ncbi:class I SAM-dependent methyltransferase [Nesterenkonia ebinurensis]|uniref:class I SAM-dependent methyltransferase n=1 Tax=Nesterenkonia ebinurensis TaxID=2608252 RepID=UPI00123D3A5B|nr:class I SAM-dependent methyltransferase [Nesterenkonia ebinurensis]
MTTKCRWNHNIHYHPLLLDVVPPHAHSALDVGTGNGLLAADLTKKVPDVVGIDIDQDVLESARTECSDVQWIQGDFMTYSFDRTFDLVTSVSTLHHLPDLEDSLHRLVELTSPDGYIAVIGMAQATSLREKTVHLLGAVQHQWLSRRRGYWEHTAPTSYPPAHTYSEVKTATQKVLPGAEWKQLPLWRYSLIWHKPSKSRAGSTK